MDKDMFDRFREFADAYSRDGTGLDMMMDGDSEAVSWAFKELIAIRNRLEDTEGLARVIGIGLLKSTGIMSLSGGKWEERIAKDVQRFIRKGGKK